MLNYPYLMLLNTLSGRTFHNLSQYPVFPWTVCDYDSEQLNFHDQVHFREFEFPMGAQLTPRRTELRNRYKDYEPQEGLRSADELAVESFHIGSHYSSPPLTSYYLLRCKPFDSLALSLQGGKFDTPDRIFVSVKHTYDLICRHDSR